jgi:hypothetical protein
MVMSFDKGRRNGMIEMLVDDDINTILTAKGEYNDEFFLSALLTDGFKGYENYTDDELTQEMNERDLWDNWFKDQK